MKNRFESVSILLLKYAMLMGNKLPSALNELRSITDEI